MFLVCCKVKAIQENKDLISNFSPSFAEGNLQMMIYLCLQSKNKTTTEKAIFRLAFVGYIPIIFPLVGLNELSKQFTLYMQMAKL